MNVPCFAVKRLFVSSFRDRNNDFWDTKVREVNHLLGCPGTGSAIGSKVIGSVGYNPNISHL